MQLFTQVQMPPGWVHDTLCGQQLLSGKKGLSEMAAMI